MNNVDTEKRRLPSREDTNRIPRGTDFLMTPRERYLLVGQYVHWQRESASTGRVIGVPYSRQL